MITRNFDIEIDAANPFANDAFGRSEIADNLTRLVVTTKEPYVLALDAGWGSGKTTFIRMWMRRMLNEGKQALYFNAWENDFASDPMISFIGEMHSMIEAGDFGSDTATPARQQYNKLKNAGGKIIRRGVPIAARLLTAGLLDIKDGDIEAAFSDFAEEIAKEQIERYEADRASLIEFREALESIAESIYRDTGSPLVFFIDELDRCRPTYAIELLERLKHLFSVPNIVFVLALDKEQLIHSVNSVYGIGMDARGYLRRFIDVEYKLPRPDAEAYIKTLIQGGEGLLSTPNSGDNVKAYIAIAAGTIEELTVSIRQAQLIALRLNILAKAFRFTYWSDYIVIPFLTVLRSSRSGLYNDFFGEKKERAAIIHLASNIRCEDINLRANLVAILEFYYLQSDKREEEVKTYGERAQAIQDPSEERYFLRRVGELLQHFHNEDLDEWKRSPKDESEIFKVIEFSGRFELD